MNHEIILQYRILSITYEKPYVSFHFYHCYSHISDNISISSRETSYRRTQFRTQVDPTRFCPKKILPSPRNTIHICLNKK